MPMDKKGHEPEKEPEESSDSSEEKTDEEKAGAYSKGTETAPRASAVDLRSSSQSRSRTRTPKRGPTPRPPQTVATRNRGGGKGDEESPRVTCPFCWKQISAYEAARGQHTYWNMTCLRYQLQAAQPGITWTEAGKRAKRLRDERIEYHERLQAACSLPSQASRPAKTDEKHGGERKEKTHKGHPSKKEKKEKTAKEEENKKTRGRRRGGTKNSREESPTPEVHRERKHKRSPSKSPDRGDKNAFTVTKVGPKTFQICLA